jgi:hypothetical protein
VIDARIARLALPHYSTNLERVLAAFREGVLKQFGLWRCPVEADAERE